MQKRLFLGLTTAIAVAMFAVPSMAQPPACSDDVCTLVPPGEATAVAPRLQIRELREGDVCFNDDDETWVPPSEVTELMPQASGEGVPTVCFNDDDSTWVVPR